MGALLRINRLYFAAEQKIFFLTFGRLGPVRNAPMAIYRININSFNSCPVAPDLLRYKMCFLLSRRENATYSRPSALDIKHCVDPITPSRGPIGEHYG